RQDFARAGRFGNLTLQMSIAEATKVSESRIKAASVPNQPATNPPTAAPSVSITDQVTAAIAFAATSSWGATIEGIAAVLAGSKNAENASCRIVRTYTSHIWSGRRTNRNPITTR